MNQFRNYIEQIWQGISSTKKGMSLTWKHLWAAKNQRKVQDIRSDNYFQSNEGVFTLQYPAEQVEIPERSRYQLDNVMEDCIVCDKCVKICPVDCIEIDPIKATGLVGYASDGSPIRLYAAKFDIDMSKCCFCGLCTTVCPTECLTMTSEYDFSTFDVKDHLFHYSNLSPEEAEEKRRLYEQFVKEKEEAKLSVPPPSPSFVKEGVAEPAKPGEVIPTSEQKPKIGFKPSFKKSESVKSEQSEQSEQSELSEHVITLGKSEGLEIQVASSETGGTSEIKKPFKPVFKPSFKKPSTDKPKDE
ncbi:4Fe-4S dicluster domain-containing protein [Sandaracinomonas limnophila]|uniref:4Fe-4S dicluster domain-containing protein n=1 Tax=Sandaracinomonas limnophila TaxID=1862386 RepID=A0A437PRZ0_9BACT|nr:4Fe-4S binding protein [Sandaracinomonas limnophila]RVU25000.1 4Fe-4S dicluster domain-containing protein [Sandaracinomonas limnophila]